MSDNTVSPLATGPNATFHIVVGVLCLLGAIAFADQENPHTIGYVFMGFAGGMNVATGLFRTGGKKKVKDNNE